MNRIVITFAFVLGAAAVIWMGSSFVGTDALALAVILVIGCVYTIGFIELLQFRQATATLTGALATVTAGTTTPGEWLTRLHPSLQNAVRLRIEGEPAALPAPVLTPYLVGLLVMLGLLGTFAGMVETLKGAVVALEGTTELQAIRAGLAAPIKGLGLAFGTSVAGVAASAMLGLISTLSRRDRMLATRRLDTVSASVFREFSLAHNRQEAYKALQMQAHALPEVAHKLQEVSDKLALMGDQLSTRLSTNQDNFHDAVKSSYSELAASVEGSLNDSLSKSGRLAGEGIKPLVQEAMAEFSKNAQATQAALSLVAREQLEAFSGQFDAANTAKLEALGNSCSTLIASQDRRDRERLAAWQGWLDQTAEKTDGVTATLGEQLKALRDDEERRGEAALQRLAQLEATVTTHLATLGRELEEPMSHLIQTASETPRAAAEVIGHLREEISNNIERDNSLLEERRHIMTDLSALSGSLSEAAGEQRETLEKLTNSSASTLQDLSTSFSKQLESQLSRISGATADVASALNDTAGEQREAMEKMVDNSAGTLQDVSVRFGEQMESQLSKISGVTDNVAGSAVEMASLGDAFSAAVGLFTGSNEKLMDHLARIEASMEKSSERSDEQMAYYVAQAREIIDQSMLSQREIFEELRQLGTADTTAKAEAS